jgi:rRNA maturation protein Nop10
MNRTRARLKLRNCSRCQKLTDDRKCRKCGAKTYPNSYIRRFPRREEITRNRKVQDAFEMPSVRNAKRIARNALRWPFQGGLPQ